MKKIFSILVLISTSTAIYADDFRVEGINTASGITIDNKKCQKEMRFSSASTIKWTKENQAIKAVNQKTNEVTIFAWLGGNKKIGRASDYILQNKNQKKANSYVMTNRLSTRAGFCSLEELSEYLNATFYMLDTLSFDSPISLKNARYYYLTYQQKGKTIKKTLPSEGETIIIERSLFDCKKKSLESIEAKVYLHSDKEEDYMLTDSMKIIILPQHIK